ncbi:MAG: response regulator, partial [Candidatus Riflebacteria bacterium]|nr:response regulator [Candidatus Riflebacteria bacterium]
AANGQEAWQKLTDGRFDLVVSDIDMPLLDGLELTRRIRASRTHAQLPVVLVTSHGADNEKAEGLRAGANAYVSKTDFDQTSFLARVRELAGGA